MSENNAVDEVEGSSTNKTFTLKRWNAVAVWQWNVENDTCAICRLKLVEPCHRCDSNRSQSHFKDCVVVWGECNHSFHNCCMLQWTEKHQRCPFCQKHWNVQSLGK